MPYSVKEIFYSLQGEGAQVGRPAVFCRFAGCNLWSGQEQDRKTALCGFCDTDFVGVDGPDGGSFASPDELAEAMIRRWPTGPTARPFVICTGGEPLLQLDEPAVAAMKRRGFEIAIETNGTRPAPPGIDWVCVSPKSPPDKLTLQSGDELKFVYPQPGLTPADFERLDFRHFFLQPMDGPDLATNTALSLRYCLNNPRWRLSVQTHKLLGLR